jgi:hypothetical protein
LPIKAVCLKNGWSEFYLSTTYLEGFVNFTVSNNGETVNGKYAIIGEGVVWSDINSHIVFKVKGEKHGSVNKVKKEYSPQENAENTAKYNLSLSLLPDWRLEQSFSELENPNVKFMSDFLKWIHNDIVKEESAKIIDAGYVMKDLTPYFSKIGVAWFKERLLVNEA